MAPRLSAATAEEKLLEQYLAHLHAQGVKGVSQFIHPDDLAAFRKAVEPHVKDALAADPNGWAKPFAVTAQEGRLTRLTDAEFLEKCLENAAAIHGFEEILKKVNFKIIGVLNEGDRRYAVVRSSVEVEGNDIEDMEVVGLRLSQGNWKVSGGKLKQVTDGLVMAAKMTKRAELTMSKVDAMMCTNNLKNLAISLGLWATDHDDAYPFNVPAAKGGTKEQCKTGPDGYDANSYLHYRAAAAEIQLPAWVVCRGDKSKETAKEFARLGPSNVSYLLRSSPKLNPDSKGQILARCPVHGLAVTCDGVIIATSNPGAK